MLNHCNLRLPIPAMRHPPAVPLRRANLFLDTWLGLLWSLLVCPCKKKKNSSGSIYYIHFLELHYCTLVLILYILSISLHYNKQIWEFFCKWWIKCGLLLLKHLCWIASKRQEADPVTPQTNECSCHAIFKLLWGKDKNLQLSFADMNEDELDHSHKSEVDLVWRNKYEPLRDMAHATMCALLVEVILVTNH